MSETKSKRIPSIDILRSLAMLMVISMHYFDKGNVKISLGETQTLVSVLAWLFHSFCIVAVNCYVLISGYFLIESSFKWKKLVELILQVLFYSVLVPVIMWAVGLLPASEINLYKIFLYIFPIQTKHYWFATAYVLLYIFSPLLGAGVKALDKKNLKITIGIALLILSVGKSVLPIQMDLDTFGYDFIWFMVLFMVAGYIRLYGLESIKNSKKGLLVYICGSLVTFCLAFAIRFISLRIGKMGYFITRTFDYNNIFCFISSIGLFTCFLYMSVRDDNKLGRFAIRIAPYTFGVYLLHEQWEMRHVWPFLLGTDKFADTPLMIIHWLICILIVFTVGICVDYLRSRLFSLFTKREKQEY